MRKKFGVFICICLYVFLSGSFALATQPDTTTVYPAAVFPFQERSESLAGYGEKVSELLFVSLSTNPSLIFVDRQEIEKILDEQELNLSGMVDPTKAVQIGTMLGAKILVTGTIMQMGNKIYLIAKVIGTETSRVFAVSTDGDANAELFPLIQSLGDKVSEKIMSSSDVLVAKPISTDERIERINAKLGKKKRPSVSISIPEGHVGRLTIDPAAETELIRMCRDTGFKVIDTSGDNKEVADISIVGEGFSEFGARRKNIVSVKARLEVKCIDNKTNEIIYADRQTAIEVDLTELIAGKKALQTAAAKIAERVLPKLVE